MSKKQTKTPKNDSDITDIDSDIELNSCSAYDCTGLIPAAVTDESELESYEELYPYLSPQIDKPDDNLK